MLTRYFTTIAAIGLVLALAGAAAAQKPGPMPGPKEMARAQRAAAAVQSGVQGRKLLIFMQQELKAEGVRLDSPAAMWVQQQVRLAQDAGANGPELAMFVQQCVQFAASVPDGRPEKAGKRPQPPKGPAPPKMK